MMAHWLMAILLLSLSSLTRAASDNIADVLPPAADPGRLADDIEIPLPLPYPRYDLSLPQVKTEFPALIDSSHFQLKALQITGNSAFSQAELAPLFQQSIGQAITLSHLQKIAARITQKYRDAGYVLSQAIVPAQRIDQQGTAKIQVVEGFVEHLEVKGEISSATKAMVLAYARPLQQARPLSVAALERYASLIADLPGLTVKTLFKPTKKKLGGADLTFYIEQKTIQTYFLADNWGTRFLGPEQYSAAFFINGLRPGSQTGVRVVTTNTSNELRFYGLSHEQVFTSPATLIRFAASSGRTEPGFTLADADVRGDSESLSLSLKHLFVRNRRTTFALEGALQSLNSETTTLGQPLFKDKLRSLRLSTIFKHYDSWLGVNFFQLGFWQGLNIWGASDNNNQPPSRPKGRTDYNKIDLQAWRLQAITPAVSALLALKGQYAFSPLLSATQFGAGGSQFGRGYEPSEITGDHGVALKTELRYEWRKGQTFLQKAQLYGFYDVALVWDQDSDEQAGRSSLASAGLGLRIDIAKHLAGTLEYAKPLTRPVNARGNNSARTFFSVLLSY